MSNTTDIYAKWPKTPIVLSEAHQKAREEYMDLWLKKLKTTTFRHFDRQNHLALSRLPIRNGSRTLELGAGLGAHIPYEDLQKQTYHCLEYREEFCKALRELLPADQVHLGNIEEKQPWPDGYFDRVVAVHVIEHLLDLPRAVREVKRLLSADGVFDIVIPCESGQFHTLGRKLTAERLFKKQFNLDFAPIHKSEHVNTYPEIIELLQHEFLNQGFVMESKSFFPFPFKHYQLNFNFSMRLRRVSH